MPDSLPEYASAPLRRFIDSCEDHSRLLHMSMSGIGFLTKRPEALKVLYEPWSGAAPISEAQAKENEQTLQQAVEEAEFAKKECEAGFPLLHAHSLVGTWGALEAAVEDMLVGILVNEPSVLQRDEFAKVKVPLADFEILDKEERMRLVLTEATRNQGIGRRQGVDVFEHTLMMFDLSGPVEGDVKKSILEMHHLRNVIVHRASYADRRLVQNCPWLGLKTGENVCVSHNDLGRYRSVLLEYVVTLARRLCTRYGVDIEAKFRSLGSTAGDAAS